MSEPSPSLRRRWRLLAVAASPALAPLWALWRDVYRLEAGGVRRLGGAQALAEWALLSLVTLAVAAALWAPSRPLRVLASTLHSLLLSVAFAVAGVIGVMHAFGGPAGNLAAPAWALVALGAVAAACVASLLATAALFVEDVRAGDAAVAAAPERTRQP